MVLGLLLFIFTNTDSVPITFFLWDVDAPLILVMLLPLLIGMALGLYIARNVGKDKKPVPSDAKVDKVTAQK
jgi:uncharacterized integral membrane protein